MLGPNPGLLHTKQIALYLSHSLTILLASKVQGTCSALIEIGQEPGEQASTLYCPALTWVAYQGPPQ